MAKSNPTGRKLAPPRRRKFLEQRQMDPLADSNAGQNGLSNHSKMNSSTWADASQEERDECDKYWQDRHKQIVCKRFPDRMTYIKSLVEQEMKDNADLS